ncbi:MAG: FtsX-like permease family protein, partial [Clostridia bacterium]|nr:FtsX-like permease family protein [Clostridia bacterium]
IMELLKEIANDKLIIMVTHNPELAHRYANRIVSCLDGQIIDDTNPYTPTPEDRKNGEEKLRADRAKGKKASMSAGTAFTLSLRNLFTKRGRTVIVAFAGSIGIIGIALILALSNGINNYISKVESDALLIMPVSVEKEATNTDSLIETLMGLNPLLGVDHDKDAVYVNKSFSVMVNTFIAQSSSNNLQSFKKYIDDNADVMYPLCNDIQFNYSTPLNLYRVDDGSNTQVSPIDLMSMMGEMNQGMDISNYIDIDTYSNLWKPLIGDNDTMTEHYDVIAGRMPEKMNEAVVIVDGNNEINEMMAYALGLRDPSQMMNDLMAALGSGSDVKDESAASYSYEEVLGFRYKLLLNCDLMMPDESTGLYSDQSANPLYVKTVLDSGLDVSIVGVIRPKKDNVLSIGTGYIGYPGELMTWALETETNSEVVKKQLADPTTDVISGEKFFDLTVNDFDLTDIDLTVIDFKYLDVKPFLSMLENIDLTQIDLADLAALFNFDSVTEFQKKLMEGFLDDAQVLAMKQAYIDTIRAERSFEQTCKTIGYADPDSPSSIFIYPKNFDAKAELNTMIDYYNESVEEQGHPELTINTTDYIGIIMNLVTQVVNIVTYTLVVFVAISLVVSSIMIGIITYVSVIERTKEIGILRAIGASKRDVSNVFNAETVIIGLASGSIGVLVTGLLEIPINIILRYLTGTTVAAVLPFNQAAILVALSVFLTFIAGLVPASMAAKKDPVEALRTD